MPAMAMATITMAMDSNDMHRGWYRLGGALLLVIGLPCHAVSWRAAPSVNVDLTYTDNIFLEKNDRDSDTILIARPGFDLERNSGRSKLNLGYRLTQLTHLQQSGLDNTYHSLNGAGQWEAIKQHLFLDAGVLASQELIDPTRSVNADLLGNEQNITTAWRGYFQPRWTQRLGGWGSYEVGYGVDYVDYSGGSGNLNQSQGSTLTFNLTSGSAGMPLFWSANYLDNNIDYANSQQDGGQQNGDATLGVWAGKRLRFSGTAGYSEYSYTPNSTLVADNRQPNNHYYRATIGWVPSRKSQFDLFYQVREYDDDTLSQTENKGSFGGRASWDPSRRWHLEGGYNEDFYGPAYDFSLTHRLRRSSFSLKYEEEVTNTRQNLLQNQQIGTLICPSGTTFNPAQCVFVNPNQPVQLGINQQLIGLFLPVGVIADDQFLEKRYTATWGYQRGRSAFNLNGYQVDRTYLTSSNESQDRGANFDWTLSLSGRTSLTTGVSWLTRDFMTGEKLDYDEFHLGLTQTVTRDASLSATYRRISNDAQGSLLNDYRENRLTLSGNMRF